MRLIKTWIRFMVHARYKLEIRKPINYCWRKALKIKEELSQKWIMYRRDYFRGDKGVVKGRLNWKQTQNDVYAREAKLDEDDEIYDDEKLFYRGKHDFDRILNTSKARESLKKISGEIRYMDFRKIFECSFRLGLSQKMLDYFDDNGIDIFVDHKWMEAIAINENGRIYICEGIDSLLEIEHSMAQIDV
jgi:hypothetical protein